MALSDELCEKGSMTTTTDFVRNISQRPKATLHHVSRDAAHTQADRQTIK